MPLHQETVGRQLIIHVEAHRWHITGNSSCTFRRFSQWRASRSKEMQHPLRLLSSRPPFVKIVRWTTVADPRSQTLTTMHYG